MNKLVKLWWPKPRYVYLIHFDEPISPHHTCQHYVGSSHHLARTLEAHWRGRRERCNLTYVAVKRNITFTIVRAWYGGRKLEKTIKNRNYSNRLCPVCQEQPHELQNVEELSAHELEKALLPF